MASANKTVLVWEGAIPASCFEVGKVILARIIGISGVESLELTISSISDGPDKDGVPTKQVTFAFDDASLPSGVALEACNLACFLCSADCCKSTWCEWAFGPDEVSAAENRALGYLPQNMAVEFIRVTALQVSDQVAMEFNIEVAGQNLISVNPHLNGSSLDIPRSSFTGDYANGRIPATALIKFHEYSGATQYAQHAWKGIRVCFYGRTYQS